MLALLVELPHLCKGVEDMRKQRTLQQQAPNDEKRRRVERACDYRWALGLQLLRERDRVRPAPLASSYSSSRVETAP